MLRARLTAVLVVAVAGVVAVKVSPAGEEFIRLYLATWFSIVGLLVVWAFAAEGKSDRPVTWAQAMGGATALFALILLAYGSVPHEWLTYADSVLKWREDKLFLKHGKDVLGISWPIDITGRAVRDVVATLIYIVYFLLNLMLWVKWQNRGAAKPARVASAPAAGGTSAFGRPVVKQG